MKRCSYCKIDCDYPEGMEEVHPEVWVNPHIRVYFLHSIRKPIILCRLS